MPIEPTNNDLLFGRNNKRPQTRAKQYIIAFKVSLGAIFSGVFLMWQIPAITIKLQVSEPFSTQEPFTKVEQSSHPYSALFGGLLSSIAIGFLMDKFGRLAGLFVSTGCFLLSWGTTIFLQYELVSMHQPWEFLGGFATGGILVTGPAYLGEISEPYSRGRLLSIFHLSLVMGGNFDFFCNNERDIKIFETILVAIHLTYFFCFCCNVLPKSPTFLLKIGDINNSRKVLESLRKSNFDVESELMEIQQLLDDARVENHLTRRATGKARFAVIQLFFLQQLCNYIIQEQIIYIPRLLIFFESSIDVRFAIIVLPLVQIVTSFLFVFFIEIAERKIWLRISSVGMATCLLILAIYLHFERHDIKTVFFNYSTAITSTMFFVVFFSVGYSSMPWILLGELFNPEAKGIATGSACLAMFCMKIVLNWSFPSIVEALGKYVLYYLIVGYMVLATVLTNSFVPETKGKTLKRIQEDLQNNRFD